MKNTEKQTKKLFETKEIEGTPFMEMHNEKGFAALFAKYQITEYHKTREELEKTLKEKDWYVIINTAIAAIKIANIIDKENEIINKSKKEEICK